MQYYYWNYDYSSLPIAYGGHYFLVYTKKSKPFERVSWQRFKFHSQHVHASGGTQTWFINLTRYSKFWESGILSKQFCPFEPKSHVRLIYTRLYFRCVVSIKMRVRWAGEPIHLGWVDLNEDIIVVNSGLSRLQWGQYVS